MLGGERRADEPAGGVGEQGGPFAADGVEHRDRVLRLLLERVVLEDALGQPGAAAVEQDHAAELGQAFEEAAQHGCLPQLLDLGDPAWQEQDVERTVAGDLVGDARAVAVGVAGRRHHQ